MVREGLGDVTGEELPTTPRFTSIKWGGLSSGLANLGAACFTLWQTWKAAKLGEVVVH